MSFLTEMDSRNGWIVDLDNARSFPVMHIKGLLTLLYKSCLPVRYNYTARNLANVPQYVAGLRWMYPELPVGF
jgi:hypothetical protein